MMSFILAPTRREGCRVFFVKRYGVYSNYRDLIDHAPFRFRETTVRVLNQLLDMGFERFVFENQNSIKFSNESDAVLCFLAMSK